VKKNTIYYIFILLFLLSVYCLLPTISCAWPCDERPGATFLCIPPGARATGVAYAYTARIDPCLSNYYNAAGLVFTDTPAITAEYLGYLPGLYYDMHTLYVAGSFPMERTAWGFDVMFLSLGTTEVRDMIGTYIGDYLVWRLAVRVNYTMKVSDHCACGFGLNMIRQKYPPDWWWGWSGVEYYGSPGIDPGTTSLTWAIDGNFLYRVLPCMDVGCVIHNIGPDVHYIDDSGSWWWPSEGSAPLPYMFRLGISCDFLRLDNVTGMLLMDYTKVFTSMFQNEYSFWEHTEYEFLTEPWKGVGMEWTVYDIVTVRGGYFYDGEGKRSGYTYGAGVSYAGLTLDIGIDEDIFDFKTENRRISLTYKF
jgi:hypothetical protein